MNPKSTAKAPSHWTNIKAYNDNWPEQSSPNARIKTSFFLAFEPMDKCPNYNFRIERKGEQACSRRRATSWITEVTLWRGAKKHSTKEHGVFVVGPPLPSPIRTRKKESLSDSGEAPRKLTPATEIKVTLDTRNTGPARSFWIHGQHRGLRFRKRRI